MILFIGYVEIFIISCRFMTGMGLPLVNLWRETCTFVIWKTQRGIYLAWHGESGIPKPKRRFWHHQKMDLFVYGMWMTSKARSRFSIYLPYLLVSFYNLKFNYHWWTGVPWYNNVYISIYSLCTCYFLSRSYLQICSFLNLNEIFFRATPVGVM